MIEYLNRLFTSMSDDEGQTMAEYAVVLGVITVAVVGALTLLSGTISNVIASVTSAM
ncbi:MAG: Flp family type IVb pilin [Gaiellales bacterium]